MKRVIMVLFLLLFILPASVFAEKEWKSKQIDDLHKAWTIKFNSVLDETSVNNQNIIIYNNQNKEHPVNVSMIDEKSVSVEPMEPYQENMNYSLLITTNVKAKNGKSIKENVKMSFKVNNQSEEKPGRCENEVPLLSIEFIEMLEDHKVSIDCNQFDFNWNYFITLEEIKGRLGSPSNEKIIRPAFYADGSEDARELIYPNYKLLWLSEHSAWRGGITNIQDIILMNLNIPFNEVASNLNNAKKFELLPAEYINPYLYDYNSYYLRQYIDGTLYPGSTTVLTLISDRENPNIITEILIHFHTSVG